MQKTIPKILISDPTPSSFHSLTVVEKSKTVSHQCKICGDLAKHANYGVMTCDSCKIFFKRNVTRGKKKFSCRFSGNCEINSSNRRTCSSCRLTKCFAKEMKVDLIRCHRSKKKTMTKTSNIIVKTGTKDKQQKLSTLNLIESDNSTLDSSQWTLISNLVSCYDETELVSIAQKFMKELNISQFLIPTNSTLPKEFFMKTYEISGRYLRSNLDLCTLSSDDRSAFLRNAADNITCLGTVFSWSWSQLYNSEPFIQVFKTFYGYSPFTMIHYILKFIDPDIIVAKLSLSLFTFSNNNSIFSPHVTTKSTNTLAIFHIQNMYAQVLWKYLLYKYGYYQSIQRFINLNQCLLAATNTVFDAQNIEQHVNDIESLIEQTELTLILDDFERIN